MPPAPSAARPPAVAKALLTKLRRSWSRARDCRRRWLSYSEHDLSSPAHMGISLALHTRSPGAVPGVGKPATARSYCHDSERSTSLARTRPSAIQPPIIAEVKLMVAPDFERVVCDVGEQSVACRY